MIRSISWLALGLLATACAHVRTGRDAAATLAEAERAFAHDGSERLVNDAFLAVLADDAILFRPAPVSGRAALEARPISATLDLRWTPVYAETSADGSLGFDTGPSTNGQRGQPPDGSGFFLSIWRRVGTQWRLALDCGTNLPRPLSLDSAARTLKTRIGKRRFADRGDLRAVEAALIADYVARFAEFAADDVRVYRAGAEPSTTRQDGVARVASDAQLSFGPADVVVAASGDLGYVYGKTNPNSETPRGYVRIYRRTAEGAWKVAADWRN